MTLLRQGEIHFTRARDRNGRGLALGALMPGSYGVTADPTTGLSNCDSYGGIIGCIVTRYIIALDQCAAPLREHSLQIKTTANETGLSQGQPEPMNAGENQILPYSD